MFSEHLDLEKTARSLLVCEKSSFQDEKCRLSTQVEQHFFNYKVSVLLPGCTSAPSLSSFSNFYLLRELPLYELLDPQLLQGSVYGLSYRTRIDEDNCFALLPNGRLVLSLDKDSYELLGMVGKPSAFGPRAARRYVVSVDLTDNSMAPGGRCYQRLLTGLKSRLPLKTDFLLAHHPAGGPALQRLLSRVVWNELSPEVCSRTLSDLPCPMPTSCDPHSFLEWLGAVEVEANCNNDSKSFLSTYVCPEPRTLPCQTLSYTITGLLLPQDIYRLVQELRRSLEGSEAAWAALTVHGFADSPVSWGGAREHGFLKGGENFYTLLLSHDHSYRLYMATGAHDGCPP